MDIYGTIHLQSWKVVIDDSNSELQLIQKTNISEEIYRLFDYNPDTDEGGLVLGDVNMNQEDLESFDNEYVLRNGPSEVHGVIALYLDELKPDFYDRPTIISGTLSEEIVEFLGKMDLD